MLRNSTVAELLLKEIGHDVVKPVDLGLIALIESKGDVIPMYVMLPPPHHAAVAHSETQGTLHLHAATITLTHTKRHSVPALDI